MNIKNQGGGWGGWGFFCGVFWKKTNQRKNGKKLKRSSTKTPREKKMGLNKKKKKNPPHKAWRKWEKKFKKPNNTRGPHPHNKKKKKPLLCWWFPPKKKKIGGNINPPLTKVPPSHKRT